MILTAVAAVAEEPAGLAALGLDVKGLVFQILNFALLLFILSRFAFRPLLKILEERRQTIAESLKTAREIDRTQAELVATNQKIVADARQQADAIISRGEEGAAEIKRQAQISGQETADRLIRQAEARISRQVEQVKADLKQEVLQLVAQATERIVAVKLDSAQDQVLIKEAIAAAERAVKERP